MSIPTELEQLFAIDDGSLPEIRVEGLDHQSIEDAIDLIHSAALTPVKYGHEAGPDAPAGAKHFVVRVAVDGTDLPELGVAPFEDAIIIDYRMGPAWDAKRVDALFELLRRICAVKPGAHIEIEPEADPKLRRAFQKAWTQYLTRRGAA